jgi:hypothetical protein
VEESDLHQLFGTVAASAAADRTDTTRASMLRPPIRSFPRFLVVAVLTCAAGCSGTTPSSPAQPTPGPTPFNLAGKWSGTAIDSSGPGQMTWQLTQNGTTFSGTLSMTDTTARITGTGTVSGSVSGSSISFSLAIPAGGFGGTYASCSASASGTAQASSSQLTGTYAGSNSCTGAITSGQFTLSSQ